MLLSFLDHHHEDRTYPRSGARATPAKDDTPAQDDMVYLALDRRQCGRTRGVIWMREDGKDFYVTGETRVNGTLPRLSGKLRL
jgi:hypothetical protein